VGRPGLASDPRFVTFADRDRHRDELLRILDAAFLTRTTDEWISVLAEAGVPTAPVNDVAAAFRDPQTIARDDLVEFEHPTLGTVRQVATPLRVGDEPKPVSRAPFLGEHTGEVLGSVCAYEPAQIETLLAGGVVTQHGRSHPENGDGRGNGAGSPPGRLARFPQGPAAA